MTDFPPSLTDSAEEQSLTGTVESIVYHNEGSGFTVFTLETDDAAQLTLWGDDGSFACTAYTMGLREGERVRLAGRFVNNPRYGRQFSVSLLEKTAPDTLDGMEKYLGSGVIKGVGMKTARRIVEAFGAETFEVIEDDPEKLTAVKGINLTKALHIAEVFHAQAALRRSMLFLQNYGISPAMAMRIYKRFQDDTVRAVTENPYRLADTVDGIGFKTADIIARRVGIADDDEARISAGIRYALWEASGSGHTFLPEQLLFSAARSLLGLPEEIIARQLGLMQLNGLIYRENDAEHGRGVYLTHYFHAEQAVARRLAELSDAARLAAENDASFEHDTRQAVLALEKATGTQLSDGQRQAAIAACTHGVLVITGGPGTGKTTAINIIIQLLTARDLRVELTAPTGRAAKRMAEATGREARTVHRLLESTFTPEDGRQRFGRNDENPLELDALIVDEVSMMDIQLCQGLMKALAPGTRLVLVGDVDQLPSVGPGNVLKDLIASECLTVVRLTEIFRQAQESAIVMNAHRVNRGVYPELNERGKDFFFLRRVTPTDVAETVIDLVTRRLPAFLGDGAGIQVLTPMRKQALGVVSLNRLLQRRLNPPAHGKREREFRDTVFREGDKVMQIKNNYDASWTVRDERGTRLDEGEGLFNGDCGTIEAIDEQAGAVTVLFDDGRQADYDFARLDELELAYAVTIHKSQGSEYRAVVLPLLSGPPMLLNRNLLYTAITRARELVVVVGLPETLKRCVDNNREVNRYTALAKRLRQMKMSGGCF